MVGLIIVFSILLGALLIVVVYYYTDPAGKDLFKQYTAGVWIIIGITPLVALALLTTIYYFIADMMHGNIVITKILNRG
jgi:magnesium-transporting ATPase (P-type)